MARSEDKWQSRRRFGAKPISALGYLSCHPKPGEWFVEISGKGLVYPYLYPWLPYYVH